MTITFQARAALFLCVCTTATAQLQFDEVLSSAGNGTATFDGAGGLAVGSQGTVFASGSESTNVFRIDPDGTITEIINSGGDGVHSVDSVSAVAVDSLGNVYVAEVSPPAEIFKIESGGAVSRFLDSTANGNGTLGNIGNLIIAPNDDLIIPSPYDASLYRVTPEGTVTVLDSPPSGQPGFGYYDAAVADNGDIYVIGRSTLRANDDAPGGPSFQDDIVGVFVNGVAPPQIAFNDSNVDRFSDFGGFQDIEIGVDGLVYVARDTPVDVDTGPGAEFQALYRIDFTSNSLDYVLPGFRSASYAGLAIGGDGATYLGGSGEPQLPDSAFRVFRAGAGQTVSESDPPLFIAGETGLPLPEPSAIHDIVTLGDKLYVHSSGSVIEVTLGTTVFKDGFEAP